MNTASTNKYLRLVNYIAASQLYLRDNFFLEKELKKEHIKKRILGHWGTVPGLNFVYSHLNKIISDYNQEIMLIIGPGHGYPALLANLYVEGSLGEFYNEYSHGKEAMQSLIKNFSWPGGFPSHSNPETPGVILEGGELGYSLSTAFGAAMDNPDLIVACIVGDGEAETGPTATAWHSNKFINPAEDGAVLPIVHINKYKISGPTIYGTMSDEELLNLFRGYGYEPIIIKEDTTLEKAAHEFEYAYFQIKQIQDKARNSGIIDKPRWPMILFENKKGLTGPVKVKDKMIEDSFRSHGIPLEHVLDDDAEFEAMKLWLESYNVKELLTDDYKPVQEILDLAPKGDLRIGMNKFANNFVKNTLIAPESEKYEVEVGTDASSMNELGKYLRDTISANPKNFRIFCPDETESNKLSSLFEVTKRRYIWPVPKGSENISLDGRVLEMLSEHTLQGWLEGYVLTGRNGVFISYEAFMMIIASMVDQYNKFLKQSKHISWRKPLPSLNFILTSTAWRQDHNGYSHQNPGFISSALNDYSDAVNIYLPADANSTIVTMEECFKSENKINIIVAGKRPLKQYLSIEKAKEQSTKGVMKWTKVAESSNPDIVFASSGDYSTQESIMAIRMLTKLAPSLQMRYLNISELTCFGIGDNRFLTKLSNDEFNELFTEDKSVIFSYHGYPEDIKSLIFNHPSAPRFSIHGYVEKGSTTTPFDMQVVNHSSRIHLALEAIDKVQNPNSTLAKELQDAKKYLNYLLEKHSTEIKETGDDIDEINNFDKYF